MSPSAPRGDDRGAALVLTLILTVFLAVVVVALAQFVTVGLSTSAVATTRTETNADASNAMNWAIEEFAKKTIRPTDCSDVDDVDGRDEYSVLTPPPTLSTNGSSTTLICGRTRPLTGEPVVHLVATSVGEQTRTVEAVVEVPRYTHGVRVADWRVDIPIDVPDYDSSTSGPSNSPPVANSTSWEVQPGTTTTQTLDASDSDSPTLTSVVSDLPTVGPGAGEVPTAWTVVENGVEVQITVPADTPIGVYDLSYTVSDGSVTSDPTLLRVNVVADPSTPADLSCEFRVSFAENNRKAGTGQLTVGNDGGQSANWTAVITKPSSPRPWQFNSWDSAVTEVSETTTAVTVSGGPVGAGATQTYSVQLVQESGEGTIDSGDVLSCSIAVT